MSQNNKMNSANNMVAVATRTKVRDRATYVPRETTSRRTRIESSTASHTSTNDFMEGKKEDEQIYCEQERNESPDEIDCDFFRTISASSAAMSYAYESRFNSFGCYDEHVENENEMCNDLNDYDLIKAAIIAENDRLNMQVDEFLEMDPLLGDDDIADLLMASAQ